MKKYSIIKNWLSVIETMRSKPIVMIPFVFIAFLECLALEIIYFSTSTPISYIANPIIRKFFGENYIHYPGIIILLPRLFYYAQSAIYILVGAMLTAACVNIFKNTKEGLPIKPAAIFKNALSKYFTFSMFAILVIVLISFMGGVETLVINKGVRFLARHNLFIPQNIYRVGMSLLLFITNILLQVFVVLTIPMIVIRKKGLVRAFLQSVATGFKNFTKIFPLLSLPFLIYLPIVIMKTFSLDILDKTIPETGLLVTLAGIILTVFIDCFIVLSATQFLMDTEKSQRNTTDKINL